MMTKSYAKITLSLSAKKEKDVLTFENVIVPIDLFDVVYLTKNDEMTLSTNKFYLPNDRRNTVYKAIILMKEKYNIKDNFKVHIVKNIPAQSGLGGGSTNAATIINMLNEMYSLNMTLMDKYDIAKQIDEDTPYCILNIPSTVEGIGEIINPIEMKLDLYYLLIKPKFGISTKRFLKTFTGPLNHNDSMVKMKHACESGDYDALIEARFNAFESVVFENFEAMREVMDRLESLGLDGVSMTGSGSCVVGLSQDKQKVMDLFEKLVYDYPFVKYGVINP